MANTTTTTPSNGSPTAISIIKQYIESGQKIPAKLKDELLFGALLNIYKVQASLRRDVDHMKPWINLVQWAAGALGLAILLLLWSMLTHTFTWPF
jgi:hypothetical protein